MTDIVTAAPGAVTEIRPPRLQGNMQLLVTTGSPPAFTLIDPGTHMDASGVHGTGVGVPIASEVAAINAGFAGLWHIPNGAMFAPGRVSLITANGCPAPVIGRIAVSVLGLIPKVHARPAPLVTGTPISTTLNLYLSTLICHASAFHSRRHLDSI